MKITKKQIRQLIAESFEISPSRFGFLGRGFGEPNSYDPYKSLRENEEPDGGPIDVEAKEEAWSGGENLEKPVDYVEIYAKESMTETKIRALVRKVLNSHLKDQA